MEPLQPASFQDGFATALMATEELRQQLSKKPISSAHCLQVRHQLEELLPALFSLEPHDDVEGDLRVHCHSRAAAVALEALQYVTAKEEDPDEDNPEVERDVQGAIARMAELNLVLHENNKEVIQEITSTYSSYQRQVIRQRAKPSIARLVAYRKRQSTLWGQAAEEEDDEENKSTHAHVITHILGQASALIHPLLMWKSNLPPELEALNQLCTNSIHTLDEQAQSLTKTVANWCLQDRHVEEWMAKSANEASCTSQLGELDGLVDELAFSCQVFDRYVALIQGHSPHTTIQELHPEWTWKYASLERYLTTQQLQSALALAHPVQIVLGTPIQVPSVVEDAQYLSTRALERAASTRSTQAIGTVAHSITSDVWSTEITGGVHQALVDQKGCWKEPQNQNPTTEQKSSKPSSSSFASALLGALDDDFGSAPTPPSKSSSRLPSDAPSSGTFLGSLSSMGGGDKLQRIRMDTYLCDLNGIHSASSACSSLVNFLDSLLPEEILQQDKAATTMIQLAREELFRYSKSYEDLLAAQVSHVVTDFCGSLQDAPVYKGSHCIPVLRYYLERENYALPNADELRKAEDDTRLNKQLIQPLQESRFLQEFEKCDADVLRIICGELASRLVDLFVDCITSQVNPKRFTDWGSLLLSKQVRTVQNHVSGIMENASDQAIPILPQWERLSQTVAVLQLEKPSDWAFYQATSLLSSEELGRILSLRIDFSSDAIAAIVASGNNDKS
jgi:hypothetical protein